MPELHPPSSPLPPVVVAIKLGGQKYTRIPVPILAIFACPRNFDFDRALSSRLELKAEVVATDTFLTSRQRILLRRVCRRPMVRLADADHYVFRSNEADVVREMNAFLSTLQ